jgi:16S rRNA (guanine527-N7)-methyltransferase
VSEGLDPRRNALAGIADQLGLPLSVEATDRLLGYLDLLRRWNTTYNLTAVRAPEQMLTQHLADCLAVIEPLGRRLDAGRLLDVGSGGGLPGVVIAIMCPTIDVTCVDSVGKKAAFIQQAAGELRLRNLRAQHSRVEQLKVKPFDVIASRAFASLADFTALTRQHLAPNGWWMAMKGKAPTEEVADLSADVELFHVEQLAVPGLDADRCLVWMRLKR